MATPLNCRPEPRRGAASRKTSPLLADKARFYPTVHKTVGYFFTYGGDLTTICASRTHGEMAADTRANLEYNHTYFSSKKIWKCGDALVGAAGGAIDCLRFIEWAAEGFPRDSKPEIDKEDDGFQGLVLTHEGLDYYESSCVPMRIDGDSYAIGTGAQAAMAAMMLRVAPKKAIEIAAKIDSMTGTPVTVLRLD